MSRTSKITKVKELQLYITTIAVSWLIILAAVAFISFVGDLPIYKNHSEQMYYKALNRSCAALKKTKPKFDCKNKLSLQYIKRLRAQSGKIFYHYHFANQREKITHQVIISASGDVDESLSEKPLLRHTSRPTSRAFNNLNIEE